MTTAPNPTPAEIGAAVAVLGVVTGFLVWIWKPIRAFFELFGHGARLKALEDTMATKAHVDALGADLREMFEDHVKTDAAAFEKVNAEQAFIQITMARRDDLVRVESNLTEILLDGFKRAGRTP